MHVVLYADHEPTEIPEELLTCLNEDKAVLQEFMRQNEGEKKAMIEWIYTAKQEETRIERIAGIMNRLSGQNTSKRK